MEALEKKNLTEILPLYIGCKCRTEEGKVGILSSFDMCLDDFSIVMLTVRYGNNTEDYDVFNDNQELDRIRLLLTPLAELTEDDCADIWVLIGGAPHLFYHEEIKDWITNGNTMDGLVLGAIEMGLITNFLIKKGYDIFYLIETRQADQLHASDII